MRRKSFCAQALKAGSTMLAMASQSNTLRARHICSGKMGKQDAQKSVDSHLRERAGQHHGGLGWGFAVCRRKPCMKRHHGCLNGKAEKSACEEPHRNASNDPLMPVEILCDGRGQPSILSHVRELSKFKCISREVERQER